MTIEDQPAPVPNGKPAVWGLVIEDMKALDALGRERYGTPLPPFNGRDAMVDAYQEALVREDAWSTLLAAYLHELAVLCRAGRAEPRLALQGLLERQRAAEGESCSPTVDDRQPLV